MMPRFPVKFSRATRNAVCKASDGGPFIGTWLRRIEAINDPALNEAISGIWCGRSGRVTLDLPGSNSMLCMGWHASRVEWSYLS
jgi:hypothetical protein